MESDKMGKKGGRARWRGTSKSERSQEMSRISKIRWEKKKAVVDRKS